MQSSLEYTINTITDVLSNGGTYVSRRSSYRIDDQDVKRYMEKYNISRDQAVKEIAKIAGHATHSIYLDEPDN